MQQQHFIYPHRQEKKIGGAELRHLIHVYIVCHHENMGVQRNNYMVQFAKT